MKNKGKKFNKIFSKLYFLTILTIIIISAIIGYKVNIKKEASVSASKSLQGSSIAKIEDNQTNNEVVTMQPRTVDPNDEIIYLSDIDYIDIDRKTKDNTSYTGWGSIQKNKNAEGNTIRLKREGEIISYSKGMGIHANRTINI